ncbi:MAG: NAD-dependent epimerase/dehydratase family protein [Chitinophagaceae bacterium]|nr:MAG: NAD-dependent epimerase/dehydratase family protein [Chitinophagaceae bacterium]
MTKILVLGAAGRFGTALTESLKNKVTGVLTADLSPAAEFRLDVMDKLSLHDFIIREKVTQVYHLAATLTAGSEQHPLKAWELNVKGLLNVLDVAKTEGIKVFWPSSIAVFGPTAPKKDCLQSSATEPVTAYGISKVAGELWCKYYHEQYGVDVRSIRYPGLISPASTGRGGTSDYTVDIFHKALKQKNYISYLKPNTTFPTMYMPDAVRAAIELMEAKSELLSIRTAYNVSALSFSPQELAQEIQEQGVNFKIDYRIDHRQVIANGWPQTINDKDARHDWNWKAAYNLSGMVKDMLSHLRI